MSGPIVRSGPSEKFTENWANVFSGGKKGGAKPAAKKAAKKKAAPAKAKTSKKKK